MGCPERKAESRAGGKDVKKRETGDVSTHHLPGLDKPMLREIVTETGLNRQLQ
jgi:hypothetical protein